MRSSLPRLVALAFLVVGAVPAGRVLASPQDSKVGDTRVTYSKQGTVVRADAAVVAAAVATLPSRTNVSIQEVKLPWIKVTATPAAGQAAVTGWIRAYETVEPEALATAGAPAHLSAPPAGPVNEKDAAAAGRQLDSNTEGSYRTSRADLQKAYPYVDRMEAETQAMDTAEEIGFIMDGSIGRRGRDCMRPRRLSPEQAGAYQAEPEESGGGGGGGGGGPLGGLGRALGGKLAGKLGKQFGVDGRIVDGIVKFAGAKGAYMNSVQKAYSPMQLYYLGRAVAANAIAKYGVDPSESRRRYVRMVGDAVVRVTERLPENFGGYNFEVLDTDEVNGVSGPGGYVLLTRGAVMACRTEDELAGILSHELAHIARNDGETALRASEAQKQRTKNFLDVAGAVAGVADVQFAGALLQYFAASVEGMSTVAISHQYSQALEFGADQEGTYLLYDVLYDHTALRAFLVALSKGPNGHPGDGTHASPEVRAQALDGVIAQLGAYAARPGVPEARLSRFQASAGAAVKAPPR